MFDTRTGTWPSTAPLPDFAVIWKYPEASLLKDTTYDRLDASDPKGMTVGVPVLLTMGTAQTDTPAAFPATWTLRKPHGCAQRVTTRSGPAAGGAHTSDALWLASLTCLAWTTGGGLAVVVSERPLPVVAPARTCSPSTDSEARVVSWATGCVALTSKGSVVVCPVALSVSVSSVRASFRT